MHLVQSTRPRKETVTACLDQFALLLDVPKYRPPWNNPIKIRWQDKFSRWSTCLFFFKQTRLPIKSEKLYVCISLILHTGSNIQFQNTEFAQLILTNQSVFVEKKQ